MGVPLKITYGCAFGFFTSFGLGVQYCLGNIWIGFTGSQDKMHALMCAIPWLQVIAMFITAQQFSNFWKDYVLLFNFGIGMFLTCATAHLNLASSAGYKYNPFYFD